MWGWENWNKISSHLNINIRLTIILQTCTKSTDMQSINILFAMLLILAPIVNGDDTAVAVWVVLYNYSFLLFYSRTATEVTEDATEVTEDATVAHIETTAEAVAEAEPATEPVQTTEAVEETTQAVVVESTQETVNAETNTPVDTPATNNVEATTEAASRPSLSSTVASNMTSADDLLGETSTNATKAAYNTGTFIVVPMVVLALIQWFDWSLLLTYTNWIKYYVITKFFKSLYYINLLQLIK